MQYIKLRVAHPMESPFDGVVLHSDFKKKGGGEIEPKSYVEWLSNNPLVQGVVFRGDWHLRPNDFSEIVSVLKNTDLRIMIYDKDGEFRYE